MFGPDLPPARSASTRGSRRPTSESGLAAHLTAFQPDPNDCVTICWTSGTESTPKGVQRTHYDWLAMRTSTVEGPGLTADDVLLNPFPMVNMAGINGMFLPWLRVGGLLVQHHPFDLATFLRQIAQYRATYTVAPPALLTALLHDDCLLAQTDLSSLRLPRLRLHPARAQPAAGLARQVRAGDPQLLRLQRGHRAARHPQDIPDPAVRALYFPRYSAPGRDWSFSIARWTQARIVDPATGKEITEAGCRASCRSRGRGVPRLPARERRAGPVRPDGFLKTGDILEIAGDDLSTCTTSTDPRTWSCAAG